MASRFQEASLVTSPSYPNAVAWSSENLIAVAAGHLVIIINPALPTGPRGLITISDAELYQIGRVRSQDLLTGGLLPSSLKRERSPCVRSLSWSEIGMSPNHGCLLAVCTAEGRVKLYRPPYSDFCAEWIEIVDISKMLYENLSSMNFGESKNPSTSLSKDQVVEHDHEEDERISSLKARKRRKTSANNINLHEKNYTDRASCSKQDSKAEHNVLEIEVYKQASNGQDRRSLPKALKKCSQEISPQTYVSREALLSSHSVAWSSLLRFSSESSCGNMLRFSLLAIGSKSGSVSIWKVHAPECYHIERSNVSPMVELTAIVQTHSSWVSTMSWGIFGCDSSNPQVVLVTGSCDGSVKIWMSNKEDLQNSVEVYKSSFFLLKEVVAVNPVQVSTLSFVVSNHYNAMHLAIGKGSGSFEVWKCEISTRKFEQIVSTNAHNQVDNYVRSWILCENAISEVPIPANTPGLSSTTDLPDDFLSCLGVALSPGNLAVALVRNFNVELLNPMYQARSQKAAVEFLWNGAQQSGESEDSTETVTEAILGFSKNEFANWESNILWSLKEFNYLNKPLVLWDMVAAMLAFKQSMPEFVELVLTKWLSVSYLGFHDDISMEDLVPKITKRFSDVPSRLLHILNVISRRVMLSELKTEEINRKLQGQRTNDEGEIDLWLKLLQESERELRERLVGLSFSAYLLAESSQGTISPPSWNWRPAGLALLQQWVEINRDIVHSQLETLSLEVKSSRTRSSNSTETALEEEKCPYCAAPVNFHSAEEAFCESSHQKKKKSKDKERCDESHKLERCCVSMQVCPPTPLWFCKCCNRMTLELAPETLFALPSFPSDLKSLPKSSFSKVASKPFCLFCGVLLQRKQPEFLLSASPV
ncbi:Transducin/WD40 repeat-like superfamily protein [Arabidopsis thaliana]|uniref:Transducin/WD40 repeat-like superfamily protein n=1 Tax=Arabidopsis thaliana TaxID=3702 RepID=F4IXX2_ARATH|nr:Transducin/WD40 repeat-like superfamily protein [Arabidopsis thaliana]AEE78538.1 Transducin/WD40 repeat-like superfamily protein [Arabidopsis thaliana]|eukprot:NP_001190040.1 Transducin/WD40 repeat-like superfamily protein [Arabidopsis thaliana]